MKSPKHFLFIIAMITAFSYSLEIQAQPQVIIKKVVDSAWKNRGVIKKGIQTVFVKRSQVVHDLTIPIDAGRLFRSPQSRPVFVVAPTPPTKVIIKNQLHNFNSSQLKTSRLTMDLLNKVINEHQPIMDKNHEVRLQESLRAIRHVKNLDVNIMYEDLAIGIKGTSEEQKVRQETAISLLAAGTIGGSSRRSKR